MSSEEKTGARHIAVGILILTDTPQDGVAALLISRPPFNQERVNSYREVFRRVSFPYVYQVTSHSRLDDQAYGPVNENSNLRGFLYAIMCNELGEAATGFLYAQGLPTRILLLHQCVDEKRRIETYGLQLTREESLEFICRLRTPPRSKKLFLRAVDLERIDVKEVHPAEKEKGDAEFDNSGRPRHIKMFQDEFTATRKFLLEIIPKNT